MQSKAMQRNTLSAALTLGRELWEGAELILNPQLTRGFGLSGATVAAEDDSYRFARPCRGSG